MQSTRKKMDKADLIKATPASLGYRMPAEWERHEATWLAWPKNRLTWPNCLPQVEDIYLQMIEALSQGEEVHLLVDDETTQKEVKGRLLPETRGERLLIHVIPTIDAWIRDYGPTFVKRSPKAEPSSTGKTTTPKPKEPIAYLNWIFNAWGGKYADLAQDNRVNEQLVTSGLLPPMSFHPPIVLEGGSIEVNGAGICMTTEQCLLNRNRNPHLSKEQIEAYLKDYLGVHKILWLKEGIAGDDTDGHIDDIARFVDENTIMYALEEDPQDENYQPLQENWKRCQHARNLAGEPFHLIPLPMPGRIENAEGRLPASYANFYIGNAVLLVPTYDHPNDAIVIDILRKAFPSRKILGIPCESLVWGLGAIHCVTQQQPAEFRQQRIHSISY